MHKRLQTICKFYNNLEYNIISKEKALGRIFTLTKKVEISNSPIYTYSFIATLIKDNISFFQSICGHIDTITNIVCALNELVIVCNEALAKIVEYEDFILKYTFSLGMIVIFSVCKEDIIQTFFYNIFLKSVRSDVKRAVIENLSITRTLINNSHNEIILLQDADLYAVISYLMMQKSRTEKFSLNKIWVQEQIRNNFLSLLEKNIHHLNFSIHVFRFKEELLTSITNNYNLKIASIWSENIIAAKNLAFSLHKDIVYINAHMDSIPSLSEARMYYLRLQYSNLFFMNEITDFNCIVKQGESVDNTRNYPVYNLFYDGVWKRVNNSTYVICKGSKWACITSMDIKNCIASANKGFEIWSTMSFNSRMQVLSNFALTLRCNGKSLLANVILKLIENSYLIKNSSICYEKERFEVTMQYKPIGFLFLMEENEITLFSRLIQILMAGNSVIVLCNANSCNLAPYCNMFATAEIPPGVINVLPIESLENWETMLLKITYDNYRLNFFVKNRPNDVLNNYKTFEYLCILKKIVVAIE